VSERVLSSITMTYFLFAIFLQIAQTDHSSDITLNKILWKRINGRSERELNCNV